MLPDFLRDELCNGFYKQVNIYIYSLLSTWIQTEASFTDVLTMTNLQNYILAQRVKNTIKKQITT